MVTPRSVFVLSVFCLVSVNGCSDSPSSEENPKAESQTAATPSKAEGSAEKKPDTRVEGQFGTAVVLGTVKFEGERPPAKPVEMQGDDACHRVGPAVQAPRTMISESGGVPHVFVYIKRGIRGRYPVPTEPVTLNQSGCMFIPHVFGIQVGQALEIVNQDETFHNVHSLARQNEGFNVSQPRKGMKNKRTFSRPEIMIKLKCEVHGWMDAFCGVLPHPFFTVTDQDGAFEIPSLPAGQYSLAVWHELWGALERDVSVIDGEIKELKVTYSWKRKP